MALSRFRTLRNINQSVDIRAFSTLLSSSRSSSKAILNDTKCWSNSFCLYKLADFHPSNNTFPHIALRNISSCIHKDHGGIPGDKTILCATMTQEQISYGSVRSVTTKAPAQARQMGAVKVCMLSPGIIHDPYAPRPKMPFWKRWFTRSGWKRIKLELMSELQSAYAISQLRKAGYSKQKFYNEAAEIYKEINTEIAIGGKVALRKLVTERMYSALKNEIKQRESVWPTVYWELIEPIVKIRTLRARAIGVDPKDHSKVLIQLTLEFLSKQKFEAYDAKGAVVSGDKNKEVLGKQMDKVESKIQLFGICNEFLHYIMSFRCPVCYSLSICRWLFNLFKETAAQMTSQIYTSLNISWHSGFLAVNRLYELVVQRLAAEAIRPVTLGDTSLDRLNPDNGNRSGNEKIMHSEYSSTRVVPKLEEAVVEDSFLKNGENDFSQPSNEENEDDEIVEEEAPGPSAMESQNKAPKKMVSINDNVEEIYFSKKKKKKKKSKEKVPSIEEQVKEEPKPLKSILKVGSNTNENWDENK